MFTFTSYIFQKVVSLKPNYSTKNKPKSFLQQKFEAGIYRNKN